MNNNVNIIIPQIARDAFPILADAVYIRRFASLVPLSPDTVFDVFATKSGQFFALITTDYADPHKQSLELKNISGSYAFEFVNVIKPHSSTETFEIFEHGEMERGFSVKDTSNYYCYYLANTTQNIS